MLHLVRKEINGQQVFDVAFDDTNTTVMTAADADATTLIYATLFSDARAPDALIGSRVKDSPRGWWADAAAGSGLWHVRRQALGDAARAEAIDEVRRALQDKAPTLTDVAVRDVGDVRSVSVVALEITGQHNGRAFSVGLTL